MYGFYQGMIGYMQRPETEEQILARAAGLTSGLAESIARSRGEKVTHYPSSGSSSSASSESKGDEGYIFRRPRQSSPSISLGAQDIIRGKAQRPVSPPKQSRTTPESGSGSGSGCGILQGLGPGCVVLWAQRNYPSDVVGGLMTMR